MNATFQAWLDALTNDDGSGDTGDLMDIDFFDDLLDMIDSEISSQGGAITTDAMYYVDGAAGDDDNDGSITSPWQTIEHALDVLRPYRIAPGVTVTIQLEDGTYTLTSSIADLTHEGTLKIKGKNTYSKNMTSVQSSSGSAGAYSIIINLDDVNNITTADYALILIASGGSNLSYIYGCHDITNVDAVNSRITIASTNKAGVPSGAVTATVIILKTNLYFTNCTGVDAATIALENLVVRGDNTASTDGLSASAGTVIECVANVGVMGFGRYGLYNERGGVIIAESTGISSNGANGIFCAYGGFAFADDAVITGNASVGVECRYGAYIEVSSAVISGNGTYGLQCHYHGTVRASSVISAGHSTADIYAGHYGYIYAASAAYSTVSPAVNTQGNEYGYIDT